MTTMMAGRIKKGGFAARSTRKRRTANEEGSVIVEMALSVPVLLLLFTGVCSFAAAYSNQLTLTQAVGAGGQYLQQLRGSTTDPCKSVITAIENAAPSLTPGSISLTLTMDGNTVSGSTCSGDQSYLVQGTPVTIQATYPCVLSAYSMKFTSTCQLSAEVTEYEY